MPLEYAAPAGTPAQPPLSQLERVVDTFVAPSKTFADILRSTSWWLPALLIVLFALGTGAIVGHDVGFERVQENQVASSPKAQARMADLTPEQRATQTRLGGTISKAITYAFPFILLISLAIFALMLWATFNFGLGASTSFGQVFAVVIYAELPSALLRSIITMITLHFGNNAESYDYKNPIGTNAAYYMNDAAPWLKALVARFDLLQLWALALTILGMAIIARKSTTQSAVVVGGFWVLATLLAVVGASFS